MIWHPKPGQRVRIHYKRSMARFMPHHGATGTVQFCGGGPGPINAVVRLDDGHLACVPRGNLVAVREGER